MMSRQPQLSTLSVAIRTTLMMSLLLTSYSAMAEITPLSTITVKAPIEIDAANSYAVDQTTTATKTQTPFIETPMVVEVITSQLLKDQAIASNGIANALSYMGVQNLGTKDQGDIFVFRGFQTSSSLWNGFRIEDIGTANNGVNGGVWMSNVEKLEVIKGPASLLYGRSEPGGSVNVITKKPQSETFNEISAGIGSFANRWLGLDSTGSLNASKTLLYRFNVNEENSDSWYQSGAAYHSRGFAPALSWQVSPQTKLSVEGQYRRLEGYGGQPTMPVDTTTNQPMAISPRRSLLPGSESAFDQNRTMISADHRLSDRWSVSWKALRSDVVSPYSRYNYVTDFTTLSNVALMVGNSRSKQQTDASMIDIVGNVHLLGMNHRLLLGADYYQRETQRLSGTDYTQTTDYLNPSYPSSVDLVDAWRIRTQETAFYLQDQVSLTSSWQMLVGGRYQTIDEHSHIDYPSSGFIEDAHEKRATFLPRFSLLWKLQPNLSSYYSYTENLGSNIGLDMALKPLKPEYAKQHEVGFKATMLGGKLNAQVAFFELTKANMASIDPNDPSFTYQVNIGEVKSTGYELSAQGALTDRWKVLMNYSRATPKVTVGVPTNPSTFTALTAGQNLPYVSNETLSLWSSYQLPANVMKGVTLGGGYQWASAANLAEGSVVPSKAYQVVSAFAAYDTQLMGLKSTLQLTVTNLFDESYLAFQGDSVGQGGNVLGGQWGMPRQYRLSVRTEF